MAQQFKSLVDEIDQMPDIQLDVVCGGFEDHIGDVFPWGAQLDGCNQTLLGSFIVPDVDEIAEPSSEDLRAGLAYGQGVDGKAGGLVERPRDVLAVELG